ncbi:DNA repair protein RadA [Desulfonatronum thiodismutans]|uniref:DNA repair protein RadA n=1 Tax=Desulfonatronum thiodismutans TaxID=159290 RepID=UPI0006922D6E|nr:DNA repair protein RadA [Desulfonatronum thiodismutans]
MKTPPGLHICTDCGARSPRWQGQCPQCKAWNTLQEAPKASPARRDIRPVSSPVSLTDGGDAPVAAWTTGLSGLDEVLGGGLMPGASMLVGGEPGIGKSTLLLQLAAQAAGGGRRVVYVSGEESLGQIKARAQRLEALVPGLDALSTNRLEDVLAMLGAGKPPALMIVDSIQTVSSEESDGLPGSVSQVRTVATRLVESCKQLNCCLILVGHVTKDGAIAGPKLLEHMVDTVLSLEGDRQHMFRLLRVQKNRFGPSNELLVFQMEQRGLTVVPDPSTYFLGDRDPSLSGTALVMALDGYRPFAVEVQALATKSFLAMPRRTVLGFDANRLHLLLAVLEKRLRLPLGQFDIYTKIGGGLRLQDPGLDLGVVAAVLSSFLDKPLPERAVLWGEVDLNGQIRPVLGQDVRDRQAKRLGYTPILTPRSADAPQGVANVGELAKLLFGNAGPANHKPEARQDRANTVF